MMQQILIEKFRSYIVNNNLDLLLNLQQDFKITTYLEDKVSAIMPQVEVWIGEGKPLYVIEELALNQLSKELRPSKFNYIKKILEEDFPQYNSRFRELGVLTYETINLIEACIPVFEYLGFTEENEESRELRYGIIGAIKEYLES